MMEGYCLGGVSHAGGVVGGVSHFGLSRGWRKEKKNSRGIGVKEWWRVDVIGCMTYASVGGG